MNAMGGRSRCAMAFLALFFFGLATFMESSAWARAGGGGSFGSRGGRSFSAPSRPSTPYQSAPGSSFGTPGQSGYGQAQRGGGFMSSPFAQGVAGGLAGGLLGNMLFGGSSHAAPGVAGGGGGGVGLIDIVVLGLILYFVYRFLIKPRMARQGYQGQGGGSYVDSLDRGSSQPFAESSYPYASGQDRVAAPVYAQLEDGLAQIRRADPGFDEERFKDAAQDLFFRIQAGWTNRSTEGLAAILTNEMSDYFAKEFETMKAKNIINRLENISVRKVEITEAWQEAGQDYVTVLFTANLLDYTVDATTRDVVSGDKMNPVKFQEFWTFTRAMGGGGWRLSAINQADQQMASHLN